MTVKVLTVASLVLVLGLVWAVTFTGSGRMFTKNKTRFDWLTTESAPREYPMRIIKGTLYYHGEKGGLYIPEASSIAPNWGAGVSNHVVGEDFKALPDRLDIRFFSFAEDKFYQGSFELPYERILELFRIGVEKHDRGRPLYNKIMVGVAPGGAVAVWVAGREQREVFFGQAEVYEEPLLDSMGNPITDRADYVRRNLEFNLKPEMLEDLRQNGIPFGQWDRFRKQYRWLPTFAKAPPEYINAAFLNGERYRLVFPLPQATEEARPAPLLYSFGYATGEKPVRRPYTVRFNQKEILEVLDKLGSNNETVYIECDPAFPREHTKVRLYNGKESIQLSQFTVED